VEDGTRRRHLHRAGRLSRIGRGLVDVLLLEFLPFTSRVVKQAENEFSVSFHM
jgi:hypothetical protein